jgi:hypothetical protein
VFGGENICSVRQFLPPNQRPEIRGVPIMRNQNPYLTADSWNSVSVTCEKKHKTAVGVGVPITK